MKIPKYFLIYTFLYYAIGFEPVFCQDPVKGPKKLYPVLFHYAQKLYDKYDDINPDRKVVLEEIANYIIGSLQFNGKADILFIGTNNATRSILSDIWAHAASYYYRVEHVNIYSGGLSPTQVSTNALMVLERSGFIIYKTTGNTDPSYEVKYTFNIPPLIIKSKKYSAEENPDFKFGAVVVCPNADINLPVIKGNNFRTSLHYFDPGAYGDTAESLNEFNKTNDEIALEMFYLFYKLKNVN